MIKQMINNEESKSYSSIYNLENYLEDNVLADGYTPANVKILLQICDDLDVEARAYRLRRDSVKSKRDRINVPAIALSAVTTILISVGGSITESSKWIQIASLITSASVGVLQGVDRYYDFHQVFINANTTANKLCALSAFIRTKLSIPLEKREDITTILSYVRCELRNVAEFGRPLNLKFYEL